MNLETKEMKSQLTGVASGRVDSSGVVVRHCDVFC